MKSLPDADYERLAPHLRATTLEQGRILHEENAQVERVYFLKSGMISLALSSEEGTQVEVGIVGREGMLGTANVLTGTTTISTAIVQVEGTGLYMPANILREEFERSSALRILLMRHTQMLIAQTAQTGLCNRLHTVEERLSRWLLMVSEIVGSDNFKLTQEFLAQMLGSRRSGVTVAAGMLRQAGLIDYTRGHISILDHAGLRNCSCKCHAVIHQQFQQLMNN